MNLLFVVKGCPLCHEVKKVVLQLNKRLLNNQILIIDIDMGDPRNVYMAQLFKTWDRESWIVPVLFIQEQKVVVNFEGYRKRVSGSIVVGGLLEREHYATVAQMLTRKQQWR